MPFSTSNLNSSIQSNLLKVLEKTVYLLVIISFRKRVWLYKLCSHNLLHNLIKIIKISTNLNELIAVQISTLFVSLMNAVPLQMQTNHLDSVFQIFVCLLKYVTQLEQQSK
jgi:hypothetical protein